MPGSSSDQRRPFFPVCIRVGKVGSGYERTDRRRQRRWKDLIRRVLESLDCPVWGFETEKKEPGPYL